MNLKKIQLSKYLLLITLPTILSIYTFLKCDSIIFSIEILFLCIYFVFVIYFTKDLFSPFIFFFVNIFLGVMDVFFVTTKFRNVIVYHPISIYEKTLFIILLWLLCFGIGYKISEKVKIKKLYNKNNHKKTFLNNINKKTLNYSMIIISVIFWIYLLYNVISTIKRVGHLSMDLSFFEGQAFMVAMFPICGFIPICLIDEKRKWLAWIFALLIFVTITLSGRRYVAIITSVFPLMLYYHYKIKKIQFKKLLVLAIPMIVVILIIGHIRLQNSHQQYSENVLLNTAITMGKYIQYGQNVPDLIYAIDSKKIDFQGFKYTFRGVIGLIPRGIWKNKPEVDYSNITSQLVYGYDKGYGEPVGQFGWAYLCFGYFGVLFSGFLTGVISNKFYQWMIETKTAFSIGLYSLLIMQVINIFTPDSQMKIILFMIFIMLILILYLFMRRNVYEKNY